MYTDFIFLASDIMMFQGDTAEGILAESKAVLETKGEWELADIKAAPSTLEIIDGAYSEITFYVSTEFFNCFTLNRTILTACKGGKLWKYIFIKAFLYVYLSVWLAFWPPKSENSQRNL